MRNQRASMKTCSKRVRTTGTGKRLLAQAKTWYASIKISAVIAVIAKRARNDATSIKDLEQMSRASFKNAIPIING